MDSFPELKDLYLDSTTSDVIFKVNGIRFPAHKFVLLGKSLVFKTMFSVNMIEKTSQEIEIKDTSDEAFSYLLKYVYTEKLEMKDPNDYIMAINVFKIAHRFGFERLINIIIELLIKMINKGMNIITPLRCSTPLRLSLIPPKFDTSNHFHSKLNTSLHSTIVNIAIIYEFANLYEIVELIKDCHNFLLRNASIIIEEKSFVCNSMQTTYELLAIMKETLQQKELITGLQIIRQLKPDSDLKLFESLINLNECSTDNLKELKNIKLFNEEILFETLSDKCNKLERDNELKSMIISEKNTRIREQEEENKNSSLEKKSLYEDYFELKKVLAPILRGNARIQVNDYYYLRDFSRTPPKLTKPKRFKF